LPEETVPDRLEPIEIDPRVFLREHCALPALPAVITRIQQAIHSEDVSIREVGQLISRDPALLAQVLKVVNSAYFGLPKEVEDANLAVAYIGLNEVYHIVISVSVMQTLSLEDKAEVQRFWFHSFYTALCTKFLAKRYERHLSFDDLWSATILHDIGKLVYLKFFPDHYKALGKYCQEHGCLFSEAEEHFSLPASSFLGTLLCDHWRLSSKIRDACEFHSLKDLAGVKGDTASDGFRRIICLGNLTAVLAGDKPNDHVKRKLGEAISTTLNLTESELVVLMADIVELKSEVKKLGDQV